MCWGRQTFCMGHTCGLVGFSGALLSGVLRSGCWTFTSKVWFFAEDISSPFRAIVPNVCLLSTFSGKERERQRVGNDHRPSLAACCGWKKKKFIQAQKKKNFFVYVAMAFLAMNVPLKLLACVRFLHKVVHKMCRVRKFNRAREIEFNFFTAWTIFLKLGTLVQPCVWLQNVASIFFNFCLGP